MADAGTDAVFLNGTIIAGAASPERWSQNVKIKICCQTAHNVLIYKTNEKHKLEHRKEHGTKGVTRYLF